MPSPTEIANTAAPVTGIGVHVFFFQIAFREPIQDLGFTEKSHPARWL
jgi:hypothetical protein